MSKSIRRVEEAARAASLQIEIERMPDSTRTASEAAEACACSVAQIVKSMVFEGASTGKLKLLLISGKHDVDLGKAKVLFGEELIRADPKRVRSETGFAIGGVSPLGHLSEIETWMDTELLAHDTVWAAAGAPNAVFSVAPEGLLTATAAKMLDLRG
ncbi:YbaK/EbsC family protein [uncultured Roseobacter sp.]|uniref:YbaK/EbsC family protein n=1 Tax=uncultured Roseobacter sp. TaxID=114847 RepID=UPI0026231667|nr:YbaK/EbsC family protein [uncultured Roseobacter sp.]